MSDIGTPTGAGSDATPTAVAEYKRILAGVLENRPSGTRQRLALALGKNRSFVSQIVNEVYPVPIPAKHLDTIFEVCRFPEKERLAFLDAYSRAHPGRIEHHNSAKDQRLRPITVYVRDLGDPRRNREVDKLVADFAGRIAKLAGEKSGSPESSQNFPSREPNDEEAD